MIEIRVLFPCKDVLVNIDMLPTTYERKHMFAQVFVFEIFIHSIIIIYKYGIQLYLSNTIKHYFLLLKINVTKNSIVCACLNKVYKSTRRLDGQPINNQFYQKPTDRIYFPQNDYSETKYPEIIYYFDLFVYFTIFFI